ncbi:MAG: glycosyltransferase family 2 protein [Coriobacteriia bacterium]|nr:glycosyltransferase family 2 protein [Coriobacteriia bacterium]
MAIIIVNWKGAADTIACVQSCLELDYPDVQIIVVDNGSDDGSYELLQRELGSKPEIVVLETGRNQGFAGGNNAGILHAIDRGAEFVWLLNNDTVIDPGALSALLEAAEDHPDAGMFGSKIYYYDRPDVLWFAGGGIDPKAGHSFHIGEGEIDSRQYDEIRETEYITGCSLLTRSSVIAEIGPMPEDYFLYWEEVDWCSSARQAGWRLLYVPDSRVWHKVSASFSGDRSLQLRYEMRNRLLFHRRHRPRSVPHILGRAILRLVVESLRLRNRANRGSAAGIRDYLRGRTGEIR